MEEYSKKVYQSDISPMSKPSVSFFCPAYFDEKNLPILIPKVFNVLKKNTSQFEILIVEDGSPDNTDRVADDLAKKYTPYVKVIHHKKNLGYGATLKTGYTFANKYEFVLYTDGDNQYNIEEFIKFLPYLKNNDAVIGFRKKRALKLSRQIQTRVFNWLIRLLFDIKVKDINCALKIIRRKSLDNIKLTSDGGFIDAELLIKLYRNNYSIKEIEVAHFPRKFGKASGGNPKLIFRTIADTVRFYFSHRL